MMHGVRTLIIPKKGKFMTLWNRSAFTDAPCRDFKRNKGIRGTHCCKPCFDRYVENRRAKGDLISDIEFDPAGGIA